MANELFVSYCREDVAFVERLIEDLKQHGTDVWYDAEIRGGEAWARRVEAALSEAAIVLVVLSPDSRESREVENEISVALNAGRRIIPIMYKKCKMPLRLASLNRHDFTGDYDRALHRLMADIHGDNPAPGPVPPPVPFYKKPAFIIGSGLVIIASVVFFMNSNSQTELKTSDTASVAIAADTTKSDTMGTTPVTDTGKAPKPATITWNLKGTIGEKEAQLTLISTDGGANFTGTYLFIENPTMVFSLAGTSEKDVLELTQLSGVRHVFRLIKSDNLCYFGSRKNVVNNLREDVKVCFPRIRPFDPSRLILPPDLSKH